MDVPDAIAEPIQSRDHVRIPRAVSIVPGVEHQPDRGGAGKVKEARDLVRRFDVARAVMMQPRGKTRLRSHGATDRVGSVGEDAPFVAGESHLRRYATG